MPPKTDPSLESRVAEAEGAIEAIAQLLANGRDVSRLNRQIGPLAVVGEHLANYVRGLIARRAGRQEMRPAAELESR